MMVPEEQAPGASRRRLVRVVTERGANCLASQQISVNVENYHSFESLYDELNPDVDRFELLYVRLKAFSSTPDQQETRLNEVQENVHRFLDRHMQFNEPDLQVFTFVVASSGLVAAGPSSAGTSRSQPRIALAALLANSSRVYQRTKCITQAEAAHFYTVAARKDMALALADFLEQQGCGFFASDSDFFREQVFKATFQVFYSVTPALKKSL
jgi:hypothetical protein